MILLSSSPQVYLFYGLRSLGDVFRFSISAYDIVISLIIDFIIQAPSSFAHSQLKSRNSKISYEIDSDVDVSQDLADVAIVNQEGMQDQVLALEKPDPSYESIISVTKSALPLGDNIVLIRAYLTFKRTKVSWLHCYY